MGSPNNEVDRSGDEGPQTDVTITTGFWMAIYPVTQADYLGLISTNPSWFSTNSGFSQDLTRPVEQVSWFDATNYCGMLTRQDQSTGRIPMNSAYRLPTEAEWEYACRAGTSTRFSYGDDPGYLSLTNYAWYSDNSGGMTHPVGQKLPNPWGLYDMAGNVLQWCQDWYAPYQGGTALDPQGPGSGSMRVLRNSHWSNFPDRCRSAHRSSNFPDQASSYGGLRVVLAPVPP
jgi:formylglycine-generating enzyme required for sulfatase activity